MIQKIIASIITGIGGHYLNKRWDKAISFMLLLILTSISVSAYTFFSFQGFSGSPEEITQLAHSASQKSALISSSLITLLWITSIIVTFIDCKNNVNPNMYEWSKSGIFVAVITSLLTTFLIISTLYASYLALVQNPFDSINAKSTYEQDSTDFVSHNFYASIYYGGVPTSSHKLPSPPDGTNILKGKFSFQDQPAKAITLSIVLNSKYEAKNIITDSNGEFVLHLPEGLWIINSIQTNSWGEKPTKGEYSIYDGNEPKLTGSSYSRHANFNRNGLTIDIGANPNKIHLNYTISKDVKLDWPNSTQKVTNASLNNIIQWEPPPGAEKYCVSIQKITREGNTTHYAPVATRIIENSTQLKLSSLNHHETTVKNNFEYGVEVFAFDNDGTLLSQFTKTYQGGTFILTGNNILIEERMNDLFRPSDSESPEEFEKRMIAINLNTSRVKAVKTLIDVKMLAEAKKLLNHIESKYAKGKKEMLTGYIFALQGDCKKSNKLLANAKQINPNVCIPDEYKALCQ